MSTFVGGTCAEEASVGVGMGAAPSAGPASSVVLREVRSGDGPVIHAMLRAAMPGTLPDPDRWLRRWHWQCLHNPFRGERPAGWVLEDAGDVVGHIGAVYLPLRVRGERRLGQVVTDYVVSREAVARGGLFPGLRLAQAFMTAARGLVPMATTANEKTGAVLGRYGCRPVDWSREWWRAPATSEQEIRSCLGGGSRLWRRMLRTKPGRMLGRAAGRCCRIMGLHPPLPWPFQGRLEVRAAPAIQELNALAATVSSGDVTCSIDWSAEYLAWRYARHPEWNDIRVLVLRGHDGRVTAGAVVFRERLATRRIAYVEELAVLRCRRPSSSSTTGRETFSVRAVLCASLRVAADLDADYLVATTGRGDWRPLFWELGFESRARNAPALVLPEEIASCPAFQHGMMF